MSNHYEPENTNSRGGYGQGSHKNEGDNPDAVSSTYENQPMTTNNKYGDIPPSRSGMNNGDASQNRTAPWDHSNEQNRTAPWDHSNEQNRTAPWDHSNEQKSSYTPETAYTGQKSYNFSQGYPGGSSTNSNLNNFNATPDRRTATQGTGNWVAYTALVASIFNFVLAFIPIVNVLSMSIVAPISLAFIIAAFATLGSGSNTRKVETIVSTVLFFLSGVVFTLSYVLVLALSPSGP